jgi:hypothetical protein
MKNPSISVPNGTTERGKLYRFLLKQTATGTMAAVATGIAQKNICRYKRQFEDQGLLWPVKKAVCKSTGRQAFYLTTNPRKSKLNNGNDQRV